MTDEELRRLLDALQQQSAAADLENRRHFDETVQRLVAESRRYFQISLEAVQNDVRLVAEGVTHVEERIGREVSRLSEDMVNGFAETQAMIKFSHAELERRVRTLEQAFSDLQSRVERLEERTH